MHTLTVHSDSYLKEPQLIALPHSVKLLLMPIARPLRNLFTLRSLIFPRHSPRLKTHPKLWNMGVCNKLRRVTRGLFEKFHRKNTFPQNLLIYPWVSSKEAGSVLRYLTYSSLHSYPFSQNCKALPPVPDPMYRSSHMPTTLSSLPTNPNACNVSSISVNPHQSKIN